VASADALVRCKRNHSLCISLRTQKGKAFADDIQWHFPPSCDKAVTILAADSKKTLLTRPLERLDRVDYRPKILARVVVSSMHTIDAKKCSQQSKVIGVLD